MKKTILSLFILISLMGCGAAKLYVDGVEKQPNEVSLYVEHFAGSFFDSSTIYTIELDGMPTKNEFVIPINPKHHRFKLSFKDYDGVWVLPQYIREKRFHGWYDIEFETKAGKVYAPLFRKELANRMLEEVCLVEVDKIQAEAFPQPPLKLYGRVPITWHVEKPLSQRPVTISSYVNILMGQIS